MDDFPEFMNQPANRIASSSQATPGVEGYVFDGADGSQMAFWTCRETAASATHAHDYDEYMIVVQGCYTLIIDGERIPVKAGEEYLIPRGVPHGGEVLSATRTIHAFGGHRAERATLVGVLDQLVKLEPIFHRSEPGSTRADLEKMTAADCWEVGASGRRYSRDLMLDTVVKRYESPVVEVWETTDFQCRRLAPDVYLLTYTLLQENVRKTRRSTIWQHTEEGWKMVFHQGTIVQDP